MPTTVLLYLLFMLVAFMAITSFFAVFFPDEGPNKRSLQIWLDELEGEAHRKEELIASAQDNIATEQGKRSASRLLAAAGQSLAEARRRIGANSPDKESKQIAHKEIKTAQKMLDLIPFALCEAPQLPSPSPEADSG